MLLQKEIIFMGYCPKCDMEFVDGITICTDCGGPLVESEELAIAMKRKEQEERLLKQQEYLEKLNQQLQEENSDLHMPEDIAASMPKPVQVYESKAQKYEDLKSSASAFLIVGSILLAVSVVYWTGIISLPMVGNSKIIFQSTLCIMGILSLAVFFNTNRSAKQLQPEIEKEKNQTKELIEWFLSQWRPEDIDREIEDHDSLPQEELSLKRFQIIQDHLITNKDLPDPAYVDALSEEIYSQLYES